MTISSNLNSSNLSLADFLRTVLRSGIIARPQLKEILTGFPDDQPKDADHVARYLIDKGKLTPFQAKKLLRGISKGLRLGPFELLAAIGRGGMSVVYLARDLRSAQLMALKILPPAKAKNEERMLARFQREMEIAKKVSHSHIAWTYEVGVHEGIYYIAMEYIPGKSLARLVAEEGPLTVERASHLLSEVAKALEHAHRKKLIHRDMKPANIMVTPNNHAKLLDLGFAIQLGEEGELEVIGGQGYVVGTMDYIAPEQIENATNVDARTDIYAMGCTLYYALTGQPPFPGDDRREKFRKHRKEEPIPIEQLNANVPVEFSEIIRRMMAKDPDARYQSAQEVHDVLLNWKTNQIQLPLDGPSEQDIQAALNQYEEEDPSDSLQRADEQLFTSQSESKRAKGRQQEDDSIEILEVLDMGPARSFFERPELYLPIMGLIVFLIAMVLAIVL